MAAAVSLALVALAGCASAGKVPEWVVKGSGAYPGDKGDAVYAVGIAAPDPDISAQTDKALNDGLSELARIMNVYVAELAKHFVRTHQGFFRHDETHASSVDFFQQAGKQVTGATLRNSSRIDSWVDINGLRGSYSRDAMYVLMMLPLDGEFYDIAQEQYKAVLRQHEAALLKVQTEEALKALDEELEKARKSPFWFAPSGELMAPTEE